NNTQSKFIEVNQCDFIEFTVAAVHANLGSFSANQCDLSNNVVDFLIDDGNDIYNIVGCQSEGAQQFFSTTIGKQVGIPINILGNRVDANAAITPFLFFNWNGLLNLEGNQFGNGVYNGALANHFQYGTVTSRSNVWWRQDIFPASLAI